MVNRVQKLLEGINIKLASVVSDIMGVSAQAMLAALVGDRLRPVEMAQRSHRRKVARWARHPPVGLCRR